MHTVQNHDLKHWLVQIPETLSLKLKLLLGSAFLLSSQATELYFFYGCK